MRREGWLKSTKVVSKYMVGRIVLPARRQPDTAPGMIPIDADQGQLVRPVLAQVPSPHHTVPPNWPARGVERVPGGAQPDPEVTAFSSDNYSEGQQPKVPAWRHGI